MNTGKSQESKLPRLKLSPLTTRNKDNDMGGDGGSVASSAALSGRRLLSPYRLNSPTQWSKSNRGRYSQEDRFSNLIKIFKTNPDSTRFVDSEKLGDQLKLSYGLAEDPYKKRALRDLLNERTRNDMIKRRIEERMKEYQSVAYAAEEKSLPIEVREIRKRNMIAQQAQRLRVLDDMLTKEVEKTRSAFDNDGKTNMDDFIDSNLEKQEKERLHAMIAANEAKLLVQDQIELEPIEDENVKREREHDEDIAKRQEFVNDFEVSIKNKLKHITGGRCSVNSREDDQDGS